MTTATGTIDLETLRRFDRPGPRYTSYPTAVEFDESLDAETYRSHLAEVDRAGPDAPISLYVHIPFCRKRCTFCACHVIATPHPPGAALKLELYGMALNRLLAAGYEPIGMAHLALSDDPLAVAAHAGRLERNFMGCTVKPVSTSIGFGVSAVGDLVAAKVAEGPAFSRTV